ncbi:hypothetical protein LshimejAT787_2000470 [Lyophyllum shimeji]|uniref:Uncharacterized protein n=1 Tax=Lyophyllum shimeji TaxID=47721 RepID=A0A9P3PY13_LYOSH|nr:hypothetical protein LshimejAT787_2000470 [Lyophyllum shimeji]
MEILVWTSYWPRKMPSSDCELLICSHVSAVLQPMIALQFLGKLTKNLLPHSQLLPKAVWMPLKKLVEPSLPELPRPQEPSLVGALEPIRPFVEQHIVNSVPHDFGPTVVQPTADAQTPAHAAPIFAQSPMCAGDCLRPAPTDSFDGEKEKGRAFINSCDLYMSLAPDAFPNEQTLWLCWQS